MNESAPQRQMLAVWPLCERDAMDHKFHCKSGIVQSLQFRNGITPMPDNAGKRRFES